MTALARSSEARARARRSTIGMTNAAVLPVPVCAAPSTSRPATAGAMVAATEPAPNIESGQQRLEVLPGPGGHADEEEDAAPMGGAAMREEQQSLVAPLATQVAAQHRLAVCDPAPQGAHASDFWHRCLG